MTNSNHGSSENGGARSGDATLTKVFVGGLAWETPKESLSDYFRQFGGIVEAVVISDKLTGRSRGYGFVTFKEAEAARKACKNAAPIINGRRANCNLASLGARRRRLSPAVAAASPPPPLSKQVSGGPRSTTPAPVSHVPWDFPPASPYHRYQAVPFYGYTPAYFPTDASYNHKPSFTGGGSYINGGHWSPQVYPGHAMVGTNARMPVYPLYHFHHPLQPMGVPARLVPATPLPPLAAAPAIVTKPASVAPNSGISMGPTLKFDED